VGLRKLPTHLERARNWSEWTSEIAHRNIELGGIEFNPHKKCSGIDIAVLIRMQNVAAVLVDESGDAGDYAFLVRAAEQQDGGFPCHLRTFRSFIISRAAFAPEAPVSPVPGCVPDPQRYRFSIGVRYRAQSSMGRIVK